MSGRSILYAILAAVVAGMAFGCTERERAGYSSIPQNSPAEWDLNPYGTQIRN
ncbi:MAG: hypothetical protein IKT43_02970 [Clostridia bacterium]|nr:hypothetical protein [Clostridia bacterium]